MGNLGRGPLGGVSNPGLCDAGTLARTLHLTATPLCAAAPGETERRRHAVALAHRLQVAATALDTRGAIGGFLGGHCFSAGVMAGTAKALVVDVHELLKLFKMLALAEYHEAKRQPTFWNRLGHAALLTAAPAAALFQAMAVADHFWHDFDRLAAQAYEERQALFKLLAAAFAHPGQGLDSFVAAQKTSYAQFAAYAASPTIAGSFNAGMLFGELLFNLLLLIDGVAALAKLAAKTPALLRLLPTLEELGPALRRGASQASAVARKEAPAASMARARPARPASPRQVAEPPPAPAAPAPSSTLAQPGGLAATEGKTVVKANGKTTETHVLAKHGPAVSDRYLTDRLAAEVAAKNRAGVRTAFNDRAQVEAAIAETIARNQPAIDAWMAANPKAIPKAFSADPGMGNLGHGFEIVAPGGPIVPIARPMSTVDLVLIPDGGGGYSILTAFPR